MVSGHFLPALAMPAFAPCVEQVHAYCLIPERMTVGTSENHRPGASARKTRRLHYAVLGAVCVLVIGLYAGGARSGWVESLGLKAEDTYYNLLVKGFWAGQLNLKREVPPGLAQLSNPYDAVANYSYRVRENHPLHDLSYYQGKLYLYFGVTPALVLFWPCAALTGHYLLHIEAVVIFFSAGFLAGVALLWSLWRRYLAGLSVGVMAAGVLALGWANFAPVILQRCDAYEVAISCGYALTMMTLLLVWRAMHSTRGRAGWLAGASLAYGLAVGARPSLLAGALILLAPAAVIWRDRVTLGQRPRSGVLLLAAAGPITAIGLELLLYNFLRFGDPLEFGQGYQLNAVQSGTIQQFSLRYLWFNVRVGLLAPAVWSGRFPFVHDIALPALPRGGVDADQPPFGVLTNIPLLWLALAAPLAWRGRPGDGRLALRWLVAVVAVLFGSNALTLLLHNSMNLRYEVEFVSPLVLLAVIGIIGLERGLADRPVWRGGLRWGWGLLLFFSVAFNLLAMGALSSDLYVSRGAMSFRQGRVDEAISHFRKALTLQPDKAEAHCILGITLFNQGKAAEGIGHLEAAIRLRPDLAEAHNNLGLALCAQGKPLEGIGHLEAAIRLKPNLAETHYSLGGALWQQGKAAEAMDHYEQALRLKPDLAEAHLNLGLALCAQGQRVVGMEHLEAATRLKPDLAEAHYSLGGALLQQGKVAEAIDHYEQALRLKPDDADGHYSLGVIYFQLGKVAEAIREYEQMLRLKPGDIEVQNKLAWLLATCADGAVRNGARAVELAERASTAAGGRHPATLDTLAAAYAEAGRFGDAVRTAQAAIELMPAAGQAEPARAIQERLKLYQAGRPYHEPATPAR